MEDTLTVACTELTVEAGDIWYFEFEEGVGPVFSEHSLLINYITLPLVASDTTMGTHNCSRRLRIMILDGG